MEIAIARTLLYQAAGKKHEALETLEAALRAAAPTGLLRIFVDECEPLQALLEELKPRLTDEASDSICQPPAGSHELRTCETRNRRQACRSC